MNVTASIITIGDELLIGQTIDTNSAFIGQELNKIGVWVRRRVAVGDVYDDIRNAIDEESRGSDIIIMTGGLGPTADDITKPLLCDYFGGKMVVNQEVLAHLKHLFEVVFRRTGPMLERNLKQAEVPDNCVVLHNARGSAPGMLFRKAVTAPLNPPQGGTLEPENLESVYNYATSDPEIKRTQNPPVEGRMALSPGDREIIFISLPGVPHEMKGLMIDEVIPRLLEEFAMPSIVHRTAFTAGQGESVIAELLKEFETNLPSHIKLAYLPNYGMVKLRLTGLGDDQQILEAEVDRHFRQMLELVKEYLVSEEDEGLEVAIGKLLKRQNRTLGTAESCTGGYIAHLITSVPGSSAYFKGCVVCYANEIKENILDVDPETLNIFGAVSERTVKEMVDGTLKKLNVDYALATSGIMGPQGGTEKKPVGTVWVAVGNKEKIETLQLHLRFDRQKNIHVTASNALNFLRKFIVANG